MLYGWFETQPCVRARARVGVRVGVRVWVRVRVRVRVGVSTDDEEQLVEARARALGRHAHPAEDHLPTVAP